MTLPGQAQPPEVVAPMEQTQGHEAVTLPGPNAGLALLKQQNNKHECSEIFLAWGRSLT